MHRSASYTSSAARLSDDHQFLVNFPAAALKGLDNTNQNLLNNFNEEDVFFNDVSKKGKPSRGERAIHLIPLVLITCALVLWWFSNPVVMQ
ncbi:hypothetical protein ABFS83_09G011100 [Erythranthe nasuta]